MANSDINQNMKQFQKDFKRLAKDAAVEAVKNAQLSIHNKADDFIDEYYEYIPKIHKRQGRYLHELVEDIYENKVRGSKIIFTFGIQYNPNNIKGLYRSNSKWHQSGEVWKSRFDDKSFNFNGSDNGIPEPEWITDNFFKGIHPGSKYDINGDWEENNVIDSSSPDEKMQEFLDKELKLKVNNYINDYLSDQFFNVYL